MAPGQPGGGWVDAGRVPARTQARATHSPWMCPICCSEGLWQHVDWQRCSLPGACGVAVGAAAIPAVPRAVSVGGHAGPSAMSPPSASPARHRSDASCLLSASALFPLYIADRWAIDFSSHVNLDGLGLRRVFVHVWLRLSRGRRVPCWSPQPTHPPMGLCVAAKLKDIQKNQPCKKSRKLRFH